MSTEEKTIELMLVKQNKNKTYLTILLVVAGCFLSCIRQFWAIFVFFIILFSFKSFFKSDKSIEWAAIETTLIYKQKNSFNI